MFMEAIDVASQTVSTTKGNSSVLPDTKVANGTQSCGLVILDSYCVCANVTASCAH